MDGARRDRAGVQVPATGRYLIMAIGLTVPVLSLGVGIWVVRLMGKNLGWHLGYGALLVFLPSSLPAILRSLNRFTSIEIGPGPNVTLVSSFHRWRIRAEQVTELHGVHLSEGTLLLLTRNATYELPRPVEPIADLVSALHAIQPALKIGRY